MAFLRNVKNEKSECSASMIIESESKKNESESKNPIESFAEVTLLICSDVIVLHAGVVVQVTGCVHLLAHLGKAVFANVENITLGCWLRCGVGSIISRRICKTCKNPPTHCKNQPTHCRPKTFSTLSSSVVHLHQKEACMTSF